MKTQQKDAPVKAFKLILANNWPSLLLLLVGLALPLLIFGRLAYGVWGQKGGILWDESILLSIHETANPQLDLFAKTLTKFGLFWGVFPLAIVTMLVLWKQRFWRSLAYWLITMLGSILINHTGKSVIHRVRPELWESPAPELNYSFPSGHAMYSMVFIAGLVILTWESKWRWVALIVGGLFVLAIGWTRLYLGVHYPSDIVAGWMVSIAWAIGVGLLIKPHPFQGKDSR